MNEIDVSELAKYKIFVGTPCYGGMTTGVYTKSTNALTKLCTEYGVAIEYNFLFNESLIQRARNYVVDEFLRSDATHLMFIDSDIGFDPKDVLALLAIQVQDPEKYDIVVGPYPKKVIAWDNVKHAVDVGFGKKDPNQLQFYSADFVFNVAEPTVPFKVNEPVKINEGGTGFMLIPRSVFVKYKENYPQYSYLPDHVRTDNFDGSREIMAYFDCSIDPESKRYLSEDYHFCRKATDIGINIWLCPWMNLVHVGTFPFKGSITAMGMLENALQNKK